MSVGFVVAHPLDRGLSDPKTGRDRGDRLSRAGKPDCFEGLVVGEGPVWDPFLPRLHQRGMVDQVGAVGDPPEVLDRVIPKVGVGVVPRLVAGRLGRAERLQDQLRVNIRLTRGFES